MAAPQAGMPFMKAATVMQPGQVIIGYEIVSPEMGCCKCATLSPVACILVIVFIFLFWPVACVICCMQDCHVSKQRPIYGFPQQAPTIMMMPTAAPVIINQGAPQYGQQQQQYPPQQYQQQPQQQQQPQYAQPQYQDAPAPQYAQGLPGQYTPPTEQQQQPIYTPKEVV